MGRPEIYTDLGNNTNGTITQKGITDAILRLNTRIEELNEKSIGTLRERLGLHTQDLNNPHHVQRIDNLLPCKKGV
jgi:hypothetical protein